MQGTINAMFVYNKISEYILMMKHNEMSTYLRIACPIHNDTIKTWRYLAHYLSDEGLTGTVVNQACPCNFENKAWCLKEGARSVGEYKLLIFWKIKFPPQKTGAGKILGLNLSLQMKESFFPKFH